MKTSVILRLSLHLILLAGDPVTLSPGKPTLNVPPAISYEPSAERAVFVTYRTSICTFFFGTHKMNRFITPLPWKKQPISGKEPFLSLTPR